MCVIHHHKGRERETLFIPIITVVLNCWWKMCWKEHFTYPPFCVEQIHLHITECYSSCINFIFFFTKAWRKIKSRRNVVVANLLFLKNKLCFLCPLSLQDFLRNERSDSSITFFFFFLIHCGLSEIFQPNLTKGKMQQEAHPLIRTKANKLQVWKCFETQDKHGCSVGQA